MKKVFTLILIMLVISMVCGSVYAENSEANILRPSEPSVSHGDMPEKIKTTMQSIWATIALIVQIFCVGCVVFAGIRYMYASAEQKADLKKGLIYLTIGAVFVFCTLGVIKFVVRATDQLLNDAEPDYEQVENIYDDECFDSHCGIQVDW